jgi:hypothetical protein
MTNSKIEWTGRLGQRIWIDRADNVEVDKSMRHLFMWRATGSGQPIPYVAVSLRTVTGDAGGNNIVLPGLASLRHRHDVIPRRGLVRAVRADAPELFEDHFLIRNGDRRDIPLASISILSSCGPMPGIGGISVPSELIGVFLTQPGCTHINARKPLAAPSTPSLSRFSHQSARRLLMVRSPRFSSTASTGGRPTIMARLVGAELINGQPKLAAGAFTLPRRDLLSKFGKRNPGLLSRNYQRAVFHLCHSAII